MGEISQGGYNPEKNSGRVEIGTGSVFNPDPNTKTISGCIFNPDPD